MGALRMIRTHCVACLLILVGPLLVPTAAWADLISDALKLKEEAQQVLRSASGGATDPKVYAQAVVKLEKAMDLLMEAEKKDPKSVEGVIEEVNSALFWARRFANVHVISELRNQKDGDKSDSTATTKKPDGASGSSTAKEPASKSTEPPQERKPVPEVKGPPPPSQPVRPEMEKKKDVSEEAAKLAFEKAEAFELGHKGDDYAIALRWFQMADEYTGTEWSMKALTRAREAQRRFRSDEQDKLLAQSEDGKLIMEGNKHLDQNRFKEALVKFQAAKEIKATVLAERSIGITFLRVGYQLRDEFSAKYVPLIKQYNEAKQMRNALGMKVAAAQAQQLVNSLESDVLHCYRQSMEAFKRGLDLAQQKDLICEARIGIIHYEMKKRPLARIVLRDVLRKYTPQNDEERMVQEISKGLLAQIGG